MTVDVLCEREVFGAGHDVSKNLIEVDTTESLSSSTIERFLDTFNRYGFVLWQAPVTGRKTDDLMPLSAL